MKPISPGAIYANPTVLKLAASIRYLAQYGDAAAKGLEMKQVSKMKGLLEDYSQGLPQPKNNTTHSTARSRYHLNRKHGLTWV